jgi:hypothetical protein
VEPLVLGVRVRVRRDDEDATTRAGVESGELGGRGVEECSSGVGVEGSNGVR